MRITLAGANESLECTGMIIGMKQIGEYDVLHRSRAHASHCGRRIVARGDVPHQVGDEYGRRVLIEDRSETLLAFQQALDGSALFGDVTPEGDVGMDLAVFPCNGLNIHLETVRASTGIFAFETNKAGFFSVDCRSDAIHGWLIGRCRENLLKILASAARRRFSRDALECPVGEPNSRSAMLAETRTDHQDGVTQSIDRTEQQLLLIVQFSADGFITENQGRSQRRFAIKVESTLHRCGQAGADAGSQVQFTLKGAMVLPALMEPFGSRIRAIQDVRQS